MHKSVFDLRASELQTLTSISWQRYRTWLSERESAGRHAPRLVFYDEHLAVLPAVHRDHELAKGLLSTLLGDWEQHTGMGMTPTGNVTLTNEGVAELEPDDSFIVWLPEGPRYFTIEIETAGPPPELVWEAYRRVDGPDGLPIHEVWTLDVKGLRQRSLMELQDAAPGLVVHHQENGHWQSRPHSSVLPRLPLGALAQAMAVGLTRRSRLSARQIWSDQLGPRKALPGSTTSR